MIVHDLADLGPQLIGRAILVVAVRTGLGAALVVLAVFLITTAVTGAWPGSSRRTKTPVEYDEAA